MSEATTTEKVQDVVMEAMSALARRVQAELLREANGDGRQAAAHLIALEHRAQSIALAMKGSEDTLLIERVFETAIDAQVREQTGTPGLALPLEDVVVGTIVLTLRETIRETMRHPEAGGRPGWGTLLLSASSDPKHHAFDERGPLCRARAGVELRGPVEESLAVCRTCWQRFSEAARRGFQPSCSECSRAARPGKRLCEHHAKLRREGAERRRARG
jgi:hypothetical protein